MSPTEERRIADALRDALERFETSQRGAIERLKRDLQAALWPEQDTESEGAA